MRIESLAASIAPGLSSDGQLTGGDGQNQPIESASVPTSAQLEDGVSRAEDEIRTRDPHLDKSGGIAPLLSEADALKCGAVYPVSSTSSW
jgi:hypothetical protein